MIQGIQTNLPTFKKEITLSVMLTWKYGNLGQDNKNIVEIDGKK